MKATIGKKYKLSERVVKELNLGSDVAKLLTNTGSTVTLQLASSRVFALPVRIFHANAVDIRETIGGTNESIPKESGPVVPEPVEETPGSVPGTVPEEPVDPQPEPEPVPDEPDPVPEPEPEPPKPDPEPEPEPDPPQDNPYGDDPWGDPYGDDYI